MSRTARRATALVVAAVVVAAPIPGAFADQGQGQGQGQGAVRTTTTTVTPRVQRTVKFNGYATYTFSAPRGRRIVTASARVTGSSRAVRIQSRVISANRTRYTVKLIFPGEQGNAGKLIVRLGTLS